MSDNIKREINSYLAPMLITIVGFFLIQSLNNLRDDIKSLKQINHDRDEWVREWTEKWQPTLDWARREMNKNQ